MEEMNRPCRIDQEIVADDIDDIHRDIGFQRRLSVAVAAEHRIQCHRHQGEEASCCDNQVVLCRCIQNFGICAHPLRNCPVQDRKKRRNRHTEIEDDHDRVTDQFLDKLLIPCSRRLCDKRRDADAERHNDAVHQENRRIADRDRSRRILSECADHGGIRVGNEGGENLL